MKLTKYIYINLKLYKRSLKRSNETRVASAMLVLALSFTSAILVKSFDNRGMHTTSTFNQWDYDNNIITGRGVASAKSCKQKNMNYEELLSQIKTLENKFETGHHLSGQWLGVKLDNLSYMQAQFLADHGDTLGDLAKDRDFTGCNDVICIINKVYDNSEPLAGAISYFWYLKTGSVISASNLIPGQKSLKPGNYNNSEHSFDKYLLTRKELIGFYYLALSLPNEMKFNPLFKSIHKIPTRTVEGFKSECSVSNSNGHILFSENCFGSSGINFMTQMTSQIAYFTDKTYGKKHGASMVSMSKEWIDQSLWLEESSFNERTKQYSFKWHTHLDRKNFLNKQSMTSPSLQFNNLLSHYRFDFKKFQAKTPLDLQLVIQEDYFKNKRYDPAGIYKQYIKQAVSYWSKNEHKLWEGCLNEHLNDEQISLSQRTLASQIGISLYQCVEQKVPSFISNIKKHIEQNNYEGCEFFDESGKYSQLAQKFDNSIGEFLNEKILKRKIEVQDQGMQVLTAQKIKQNLMTNVDPSSVYINCFKNEEPKSCFYETMGALISKEINKFPSIDNNYKKSIKKGLLYSFNFEEVKKKSHFSAKRFITPLFSKVNIKAQNLWNSCKGQNFKTGGRISDNLAFNGGKNFVNANLLKCINDQFEDQVEKLLSLSNFRNIDEQKVVYKLKPSEKEFAKTFISEKFEQSLYSILEKEVTIEKKYFKKHFSDTQLLIIDNMFKDKEFFDNVYSFKQVNEECLDRVSQYYPQKFFYYSKTQVDNKFGSKICNDIVNEPEINKKLKRIVADKWKNNFNFVEKTKDELFRDYAVDCKSDYPLEKGRSFLRNKRLRQICIEESYDIALDEAIEEWRDEDGYDYFSHREEELGRQLYRQKPNKIRDIASE